ncbi:MAG: hypothetical protein NEA02_16995 [Thermoanaerobaculia bacterium]|nr:hypothetical protein [Thermoanaerobaculia bacterium]
MTHRAVLSAVLVAVLAVPAAAGLADTPCDLLPTTNKKEISPAKIEDVLCNVCGSGLPVHGARDRFGNGLDYNDGKRWECEVHVGNRGNGQCKNQTKCLPGGDRFFDNGVYRCRYPAVVVTVPGLPPNPRESCERGLPLAISTVDDGHGLHTLFQGQNIMFVKGTGAGNATSGEMTGGITVAVGELFRRLGSSSVCLPPNCQDVKLVVPAGAVGSNQTLTLYTPHRYRSATAALYVSQPAVAKVGGGAVRAGAVIPAARAPQDQSYSAGLGCPGSFTSASGVGQSGGPSPVFEVRSAQVQATAAAMWINSRAPGGVSICGQWTGPYAFTIRALDGQGDVAVPWQPISANPPGQNMGGSRTVTLSKGKWQIVPDASFPPDFTYTVSFRD